MGKGHPPWDGGRAIEVAGLVRGGGPVWVKKKRKIERSDSGQSSRSQFSPMQKISWIGVPVSYEKLPSAIRASGTRSEPFADDPTPGQY